MIYHRSRRDNKNKNMQLFLRPLLSVERISRFSDKHKLIAENGVEASLLIEPDDTSSMIYKLASAALNEKFSRQKSAVQTGGSIFITVCTPGFYNYKWWDLMKEEYKADPDAALIYESLFREYDTTDEEMSSAVKQNNYPPPGEEQIGMNKLLYLFWKELSDKHKGKVFINDPALSELYDYRVSYRSDEVICVKSKYQR
jgi:hypothetical protein